MNYSKILEQMCDGDIPNELFHRVNRVNGLMHKCGGSLNSRQVIATIVENYYSHGFPQEQEEDFYEVG